jgi:cysteine desulfuration protein SufE
VAHAYPDALQHILTTFRDASPSQCLELLVAYAGTLPELPEALQQARDTMEQVDECATPVFLSAQLHEGHVYYYIDVPHDAPTIRGFAGLLHAGLNGATPAAIAATPDDLCQQLGLQKALGALRGRGLTALLKQMKRNARDLANPM